MNQTRLLISICMAMAGTVFSATSVQAFDFALNNHDSGAGTYSYNITVAPGETFDLGDPLALTGLGGITAVNSTDNADLQFSNSFGSISADFSTTVTNAGSTDLTFSEAIILTSSNSMGTIDYSGSSSTGAFSGTAQGPVDTPVAVPFEPSANLGIFALLGLVGLNHYRKKFKSND